MTSRACYALRLNQRVSLHIDSLILSILFFQNAFSGLGNHVAYPLYFMSAPSYVHLSMTATSMHAFMPRCYSRFRREYKVLHQNGKQDASADLVRLLIAQRRSVKLARQVPRTNTVHRSYKHARQACRFAYVVAKNKPHGRANISTQSATNIPTFASKTDTEEPKPRRSRWTSSGRNHYVSTPNFGLIYGCPRRKRFEKQLRAIARSFQLSPHRRVLRFLLITNILLSY